MAITNQETNKIEITTTHNSIKVNYRGSEYHFSTAMTAVTAVKKMIHQLEDVSGMRDNEFHPINITNKKGYISPKADKPNLHEDSDKPKKTSLKQ